MISYSNILFVFNNVKNRCHNKNKLMKFIRFKNCYLYDILEKLRNNSYSFSNYHIFLIHEKKYRIIMSETISDKIVNQLVGYFILLPSFKCLIDSNIATRKGRGSSYGYRLFEKYVNDIGTNKNMYVLRIDIKKYFYNISHVILLSMLERRIKDKKAINILKKIIDLTDYDYVNDNIKKLIDKEIGRVNSLNISIREKDKLINELKSIPLYRKGYGLSIGCLTNQLMAIFYLNDIDHIIKEELNCSRYIRYMDDLYLISDDKGYLECCFDRINDELNRIELNINNKSGIYRLKEGVSFLGYTYTLTSNKLLVRYDNNTIRRIDKKLKYLFDNDFNSYYSSISSYKGYFIRCNTNLFFDKYNYLCIYNNYDKYRIIKKRYKGYIVFIKVKNRYYTYDDDLIYINGLFGTNVYYFKYYKLLYIKMDYVILEGNCIMLYKYCKENVK